MPAAHSLRAERAQAWAEAQLAGAIWRADALASAEPAAVLPTGFAKLDAQLPGGGWPQQALTELLIDGLGLGELQLLLPALVAVSQAGLNTLWIAPPALPYAPALAQAGLSLSQLWLLRPKRPSDAAWALEQGLRSSAVGAVLAWLPASHTTAAWLRRLQLAAAASRSVCFVFRPRAAQMQASAAPLRLLLAGADQAQVSVQILKRRAAPCTKVLHIDLAGRI